MIERRFAPRCGECRQKTMALASVPYSIQISHDGKKYDVNIPALSVPKCQNPECGALSIDSVAGEQIECAFRRVANLLTPEEIRQGRIKIGYANQQEFAACFGVSPSTVSRWENGSQVQQHFHDGMLRAFFQLPAFRQFLAELHGMAAKVSSSETTEQLGTASRQLRTDNNSPFPRMIKNPDLLDRNKNCGSQYEPGPKTRAA